MRSVLGAWVLVSWLFPGSARGGEPGSQVTAGRTIEPAVEARSAAPRPGGGSTNPSAAPAEGIPESLRLADDGEWLEVLPVRLEPPREPDAEVGDDTTVIWQDDQGLITVRASRRDRQLVPLLPPARSTSDQAAGDALLSEAEAALAKGQFFDARRRASLARGYLPESARVYGLLGRIALAQNDHEEARWSYERAKQFATHPAAAQRLDGVLATLVKEVGDVAPLPRFETEHFVVSSPWAEGEPNALVLAEALEQAWVAAEHALGVAPRGKVRAVVYRHEQFSARVGGTTWAAGDFDGRVRIGSSLVGTALMRTVLTHEVAHAFVADRGARVPAWLNEGIAQWVADESPTPPTCSTGHGFELGALGTSFGGFASCREARVAYAAAHHAVGRLSERYGAEAVGRLVRAMRRGGDESYFEEALGPTMGAFVREFDAEAARPRGQRRD